MTGLEKGKRRKSLIKKAQEAAGRARCTKCKFWFNGICTQPNVVSICHESYVKGYLKGYKQRRKDIKK